ncbi:FAD-binding protein, partial [Salidesulfovibrio brasiliensis]|uniref:FAD-binding protein n=1 Tax=Salidesulfovibrio brasiliensis TaxID=221711 RepID=UPI000B0054E8
RSGWHRLDYFDQRGHAVHRAGVRYDETLRPLGENGKPLDARLYAAGSVLAGADWMRMKCGAGVAISTAFKAVSNMTD